MPSQRSHLVKTKIWKKCHNSSTLAVSLVVTTRLMQRWNPESTVFRPLSRLVWYQSKINVHTKVKLFKSTILPTLLCGSETWNLLQHHIQRLQVFTNRSAQKETMARKHHQESSRSQQRERTRG